MNSKQVRGNCLLLLTVPAVSQLAQLAVQLAVMSGRLEHFFYFHNFRHFLNVFDSKF